MTLWGRPRRAERCYRRRGESTRHPLVGFFKGRIALYGRRCGFNEAKKTHASSSAGGSRFVYAARHEPKSKPISRRALTRLSEGQFAGSGNRHSGYFFRVLALPMVLPLPSIAAAVHS